MSAPAIEFRRSRTSACSGIAPQVAFAPLFVMWLGATLAVIGVVVGELVGGNLGLGYLLTFGAYGAVIFVEHRVLHYIPQAKFHSV